ncbi:ABC transporter permease [Desulfobacca acetoxidans]
MDLAIRDIRQHLGRFLATVVGIGLLFAIVLSMNGIYRGFVFEGLALINSTNPDLWVVERYRGGPINEQSILPEFFHYSVAAMPGVEKASPFIVYPVERHIAGKSRRFTIIGYDVFTGLGGPKKLLAGRPITQAHYEAVAHQKLGLRLNENFRLGLHTYTVVGLTKEGTSPDGEPLLYLSLPDAQEVIWLPDNEEVRNQRLRIYQSLVRPGLFTVQEAEKYLSRYSIEMHRINAVLVRLMPGAQVREVAQSIRDYLYLSVFTTPEQIEIMSQGRLNRPRMQLFLFRTLLLIVCVVIIAMVIFTLTMEKIRSIAVMKLIGAPNRVIIRLIIEQSILLTSCSYLIGWVIIHNTYHVWPRLVLLTPLDDLVTFGLALLGGIIASLLGIWKALKTPPALALGEQ